MKDVVHAVFHQFAVLGGVTMPSSNRQGEILRHAASQAVQSAYRKVGNHVGRKEDPGLHWDVLDLAPHVSGGMGDDVGQDYAAQVAEDSEKHSPGQHAGMLPSAQDVLVNLQIERHSARQPCVFLQGDVRKGHTAVSHLHHACPWRCGKS